MPNSPDVFLGPTFADEPFASTSDSGYVGTPATGSTYGVGYAPTLDISEEFDVDRGLYGESLFYAEEWW